MIYNLKKITESLLDSVVEAGEIAKEISQRGVKITTSPTVISNCCGRKINFVFLMSFLIPLNPPTKLIEIIKNFTKIIV